MPWERVPIMRSRSLRTPPKSEYYRLANQFEQLASSASYEPERRSLKARAYLFRRLGDARLDTEEHKVRFRPKQNR